MAGQRLLSEKQCRQAKPASKMYYLSDGGGLRLRCRSDGGKTWMFRFYFNKTEKSVGIGSYPKVTLNIARTVACEYKALVLAQTDTAIGQLLEMRANRGTDANVIVFDEDSVDASVAAA